MIPNNDTRITARFNTDAGTLTMPIAAWSNEGRALVPYGHKLTEADTIDGFTELEITGGARGLFRPYNG